MADIQVWLLAVNTEHLTMYNVGSSHKVFSQVTTCMSQDEVCLSRLMMLLKFGWEFSQQMKDRAQIPGWVQTCYFDKLLHQSNPEKHPTSARRLTFWYARVYYQETTSLFGVEEKVVLIKSTVIFRWIPGQSLNTPSQNTAERILQSSDSFFNHSSFSVKIY